MSLKRPTGRLVGRELARALTSIRKMRLMDGIQPDGSVVVGCHGLGYHYPREDEQCCWWCNAGVFSAAPPMAPCPAGCVCRGLAHYNWRQS